MADLTTTTTSPTDRSGAVDDRGFVAGWLDIKASNANTRRAYQRTAATFLAHLDELGSSLQRCNVADLQSWLDTLSGYSAGTQRQRISVIKSLFSFAKETGYSSFNVAAVLKPPKVANQIAERILTEEEIHRLFEAAPERTELMMRALYYTGARISEIVGLRWDHIHDADDGGAVLTIHGKGGDTRHVHLNASQAERLTARRQSSTGPVFETRTGKPIHPDEARNMIRRVAEKDPDLAGRGVSPHWFRHSHATHALNRGAPPQLVQSTLGHSSLATTGRYAHASPKESSGRYLA